MPDGDGLALADAEDAVMLGWLLGGLLVLFCLLGLRGSFLTTRGSSASRPPLSAGVRIAIGLLTVQGILYGFLGVTALLLAGELQAGCDPVLVLAACIPDGAPHGDLRPGVSYAVALLVVATALIVAATRLYMRRRSAPAVGLAVQVGVLAWWISSMGPGLSTLSLGWLATAAATAGMLSHAAMTRPPSGLRTDAADAKSGVDTLR